MHRSIIWLSLFLWHGFTYFSVLPYVIWTVVPLWHILLYHVINQVISPCLSTSSHLGSVQLGPILIWISESGLFNYYGLENLNPDSQSNQSSLKPGLHGHLITPNPNLDCDSLSNLCQKVSELFGFPLSAPSHIFQSLKQLLGQLVHSFLFIIN